MAWEVVAHGGLTVGINAKVTCEPLSPLFSGCCFQIMTPGVTPGGKV